MSRIVRSPSTGSSVLGRSSVSGSSRRPAPAASTMPISRPRPPRRRRPAPARAGTAPAGGRVSPTNSAASSARQRRRSRPAARRRRAARTPSTSRPSQPQAERPSPTPAARTPRWRRPVDEVVVAEGDRARAARTPPGSASPPATRADPQQPAYSTARSSGGTAQRSRSVSGRAARRARRASTSPRDDAGRRGPSRRRRP